MDKEKEEVREQALSSTNQRLLIGAFGISMPIILAVGGLFFGFGLQESLSAYYYTPMLNALVGILYVLAAVLFVYKGYDYKDNIITTIAGVGALMVAIFPCFSDYRIVHLSGAVLVFVMFSILSYFFFTKSKDKILSKKKKIENKIYKISGIVIMANILILVGLFAFVPMEIVHKYSLTFWSETVILLFFGISWITKSKVIKMDIKDD